MYRCIGGSTGLPKRDNIRFFLSLLKRIFRSSEGMATHFMYLPNPLNDDYDHAVSEYILFIYNWFQGLTFLHSRLFYYSVLLGNRRPCASFAATFRRPDWPVIQAWPRPQDL